MVHKSDLNLVVWKKNFSKKNKKVNFIIKICVQLKKERLEKILLKIICTHFRNYKSMFLKSDTVKICLPVKKKIIVRKNLDEKHINHNTST